MNREWQHHDTDAIEDSQSTTRSQKSVKQRNQISLGKMSFLSRSVVTRSTRHRVMCRLNFQNLKYNQRKKNRRITFYGRCLMVKINSLMIKINPEFNVDVVYEHAFWTAFWTEGVGFERLNFSYDRNCLEKKIKHKIPEVSARLPINPIQQSSTLKIVLFWHTKY